MSMHQLIAEVNRLPPPTDSRWKDTVQWCEIVSVLVHENGQLKSTRCGTGSYSEVIVDVKQNRRNVQYVRMIIQQFQFKVTRKVTRYIL